MLCEVSVLEYSKDEILEKCRNAFSDIKSFYKQPFINYNGKTADTNEYYTEIVAEFLCDNIAEFKGKFASEDGRCLIADGTLIAFAVGCGDAVYIIPDGVTTIGKQSFEGCDSLLSVIIPESVTIIETYAFYWCSNLITIAIPEGVTSIGRNAFSACVSLNSVYCKAITPPSGSISMFDSNASDRKIYVPMESVEAYKAAEYWSEYADAIVGYEF